MNFPAKERNLKKGDHARARPTKADFEVKWVWAFPGKTSTHLNDSSQNRLDYTSVNLARECCLL